MVGREFFVIAAFFLLMATQGRAQEVDYVMPTRIIRAQEVVGADLLTLKAGTGKEAAGLYIQNPEEVIGLEARVALYPNRPIRPEDLVPPALVNRNQMVELVYNAGSLSISAEGRALQRAAAGDTIRVMNTLSRVTVSARVLHDGRVEVISK